MVEDQLRDQLVAQIGEALDVPAELLVCQDPACTVCGGDC